jgi:hypothetical protein
VSVTKTGTGEISVVVRAEDLTYFPEDVHTSSVTFVAFEVTSRGTEFRILDSAHVAMQEKQT